MRCHTPRPVAAVALSAALALAPLAAQAGGAAPAAMPPAVIVEDTATSNGGIVVPILTALIILLVLTHGDGSAPTAISDARLKTDITPVGQTADGLTLYSYRYIGSDTLQVGVLAQEVLTHRPDAVVHLPGGLMAVDYARLGLPAPTLD